jgi:hypothetical protein
MRTTRRMTSSNIEFGKIYTAFIYFKSSNDSVLEEGKRRAVIIFTYGSNDQITAFQISSQINTPFNKKYGYELKDWAAAGLKKPSIVNLHPKDKLDLVKEDLKNIVGELLIDDKRGLLVKYTSVQDILKKRQKRNELER